LRRAYDEARSGDVCRVVTVVGEAGVGKSRLAGELVGELAEDATVVIGRCVSYGQGATYLPLAEIVRQVVRDGSEGEVAALLGDAPDARPVARHLRQLLGWEEGAPPPGEGVRAVRRLLEALAAARPLVVVLEDVHWAEPTLLDLVESLDARATGRILLLCLARPDLLDARPAWPVLLTLSRLSGEASIRLVENLPGASDVPAEVRERIVAAAEGNALYAEQLLAHVVEDGDDVLDRVPPSVEALLASRLDRLPEDERGVLERAAVVGREFWRGAVVALSEQDVAAPLAALAGRGLVEPTTSTLTGEEALSFHHVLIRDVAYGTVTKERRSILHERVGAWLTEREPGWDEIIGYHLEQAYRWRAEIAPDDGDLWRLAEAAGTRLVAGGTRALRRGDAPATINLLERAARLLPESDRRAEAICDLALAQRMGGLGERVGQTLVDAVAAARTARSRRVELRAAVERAHAGLYGVGDLDATPDEVLDAAAAALPVLEELDDRRALGRTWLAVADAHTFALQFGRAREAAAVALECYRDAGFSTSVCVGVLASAAYWGDHPVRLALRGCRALLADVGDDGLAQASLAMVVGGLEGMRGRFDVAVESFDRARRTFEEYGQTLALSASWNGFRARLADLNDDQIAREDILRASCVALAEIHQHADLATHAAELADTLEARGALDEAEASLDLAERYAVEGDVLTEVVCSMVRAKLLARRAKGDEARALADRALHLLDPSDALNLRARALLVGAHVRRLSGDTPEEAATLVAGAVELYRRKGNTVMAKRAATRLADFART
jgi:tetratricopeptide (TPR) repeat protein